MNKPAISRILISRTDNIGDVILTLPVVHVLKQHFPTCQIVFLGREYVRSIVQACPLIDSFLSWDALDKIPEAEAINLLKAENIDVALHVFPRRKIARLVKKAKISLRIGTGHRWYHYFACNRRVDLNRSHSTLHEAQLNFQLLAPLGIKMQPTLAQLIPWVKLTPALDILPAKITALLDPKRFNLILHPFSNGHAKEWPLEHYQTLIHALPIEQFNIFISGSAAEAEMLQPLIAACPTAHAVCGQVNLAEFLCLIARCDGLLASSTGPLHMAAAVGIKALGVYPPPQGINPSRWAPLGEQAKYLVHAEPNCVTACQNPDARSCACLRALNVEMVRDYFLQWTKSI